MAQVPLLQIIHARIAVGGDQQSRQGRIVLGPLPADQVFLDLEDACAPLAKPQARKNIVAALNEGGWEGKIRAVRVNDWTTQWTYRDVVEVLEGAGANLDAIMLPRTGRPEDIAALALYLASDESSWVTGANFVIDGGFMAR